MTSPQKIALTVLMFLPGAAALAESPQPSSGPTAVYRMVQSVPAYQLRRPQITTGARISLFANFLQHDPGVVLLDVAGTTAQCDVLQWKPNSVTVQLPRLGLGAPTDARLRIVKPDGRVAKTMAVQLIAQPEIVVHQETIAQPMPAVGSAESAVYAEPTSGGITFYSE
ncbi:hypothetical protein [Stieleria mannarensis]|uniref:hypothetical protein n=1 Tax=Stieleria mannarensis TaxID=2755585 RepID=UPI0016035EBA|nr:hypothetical protein [Rhodopirellula sp. JC639]